MANDNPYGVATPEWEAWENAMFRSELRSIKWQIRGVGLLALGSVTESGIALAITALGS